MALRHAKHLDLILNRHVPRPQVFVESGTFHGKTTRFAVARFREVRTIELQARWYQDAVRELVPLGVACYNGDSAEIIPLLAAEIKEPVCWYLDAHYFKVVPDVAGQAEGLPLWVELEAVAKRAYRDIIIVDDVHCMGTSEPTPEWLDVGLDSIAALFPGHQEALIMGDQVVVYR